VPLPAPPSGVVSPQVPAPAPGVPLPQTPLAGNGQPGGGGTLLGGGGSSIAGARQGEAGFVTELLSSSGSGGRLVAGSAARSEQMSPSERRRFFANFWGKPLSGKSLRRLRARLLEHWSCAGVLASPQRRVLVMRAGLFGRRPAAWRAVARRLGVSAVRAVRLARSGLVRLSSAGTCIDAGGAALGTSIYPPAPGGEVPAQSAHEGRPKAEREAAAVLGAFKFHPDVRLGLLDQRDHGARGWLLAFLAILLALVAATAAAGRKGYLPALAPTRRFEPASDKPLLFLDVDGVISLRLLPGVMPRGEWHHFGLVQAYVSEHAGEHIRALQRRFEIVWATGWEQGANRYFRPMLGLEEDLHVLEFGLDAASGPSDWKIKEISRAGGGRPVAWVDDGIVRRHERWARSRKAPTMLVKTDPYEGISGDEVARLIEWADAIASHEIERGRFTRRGRTERVAARH
jgi:hypothetical protein